MNVEADAMAIENINRMKEIMSAVGMADFTRAADWLPIAFEIFKTCDDRIREKYLVQEAQWGNLADAIKSMGGIEVVPVGIGRDEGSVIDFPGFHPVIPFGKCPPGSYCVHDPKCPGALNS